NYINVRTTLLASLVFETMVYGKTPVSYGFSLALIAACLFIRRPAPLWDQRIEGISLDNLMFMGFYPLIVMVLGGLLKNAQRLASDRKRLVEQLRKASTSLVETNIQLQEHVVRSEEQAKLLERERISRELHDTIGYTLMNIIATMKASMELSRTDTARMLDFMGQGIEQAQKGLAETRAALRTLRTASSQRLSLVTTLNRLVSAFENTHIVVTASYSNIPWFFGEEIDSTIYRIVQEGITNAIRHGNATVISIHVSWDGERISVTVTDNGSGAKEVAEGIGMKGIRERLMQVSGGVSAGNAFGGFQLYAWIPMKRSA
ncbi:MAG TPA: sensor histidine kinase, partial [Spirochaetia bacterium]|nr:sensor histidine kinase [Spirochaetia bacterium]